MISTAEIGLILRSRRTIRQHWCFQLGSAIVFEYFLMEEIKRTSSSFWLWPWRFESNSCRQKKLLHVCLLNEISKSDSRFEDGHLYRMFALVRIDFSRTHAERPHIDKMRTRPESVSFAFQPASRLPLAREMKFDFFSQWSNDSKENWKNNFRKPDE